MQAAPQELERLDALASCHIVGTPAEPEFDALVRLAAELTGSSQAVITFVDAERLWVKAAYGCAPGDYPRLRSPCDLAIQDDSFFELTLLEHRDHPLLVDAGSYAAVPLCDGKRALGTLAVFARGARALTPRQREHLEALALQTMALLELRRLRDRRRTRSEALYHSATRITGIGCWEWDLASSEITLTAEMFSLFGVDTSFPLTWDQYVQFIHPDDRQQVLEHIELVTRGEASLFPDYRIVRTDGQVRTVHATCEMERDDAGKPLRLTGALHDVTALRAAEEHRKQAALKAVQTQKLESLGVLSGGVAHEFNNLLVGVLGYAELALADRSLAPATRDLLAGIVVAAQRASSLTRQLLAYTGRSHLRFIELDLATQVDRLLERMRAALPLGVTLNASLPSALPAIRADVDQLQLLTSNLVLNAAEAYGREGGEVTLRVFSLELGSEPVHDVSMPTRLMPGCYVVLEVADHGCGMEGKTLERALEPFFSTKFTGRGLGLSAVLGIARSHNGVLTVDSSPGSGSRLRLHFPSLERTVAPHTPSEPPLLRGGQLSGHTVLLVDDEALVRNVERNAMQRAGLTVLEAQDGEQAIEVFRQNRERIDLVVLDLVMPGLDAAATLRSLRELKPGVPAIVQSGYSEEDASHSMERVDGQLAFLQKPFSVQTMLSKVASVLHPK